MKNHALLLALLLPCSASASDPAVHLDVFASDDADDTSVVRTGVTVDYRFETPDSYRGIALEQMRIRPQGGDWWSDERLYIRFAENAGAWKSKVRAGTDGDSLLGSASLVREGRWRQEYFAEREILETPSGIDRGLYHTFVGGAWDVPLDEAGNRQLTLLAGAQDFGGDNLRSHLRANLIAMINPDWGLTAQLRVRGFHNTTPRELDYYSPRWFAEALPVVQIRRFHDGWMYSGAVGIGWQRDANAATRAARLVEASATSPRSDRDWYLRSSATYTNTPTGSGSSYGYRQLMLELVKVF